MLVHLHETLGSYVDLFENVLFHSDIVLLVVTEEGTVRADALLAVDADDFDFALMHWAHARFIFFYLLDLRDSNIRSDRYRPACCTRVVRDHGIRFRHG
jgi:hypothetical protein